MATKKFERPELENPPPEDGRQEERKPQLVKMTRFAPSRPGGPTTADVHPDEVPLYLKKGWQRRDDHH